jgi:branched-chain amino acid transport system substrate-binding protein
MLRRRGLWFRATPPNRRAGRVGIAILVAAVGLPACARHPSETVRIGVIAPLSGPLGTVGLGIRNGVDLAVRQANEQHRVKGWRIAVTADDDTAVPDVGANAATSLSDNRSVMAVVGTLNSDVATTVAPILNSRKVVMISPANTDPALTRGTDPKTRVRPFPYYFRVAASDLTQGPFAATFAYQTAGKRNVVVIHDKTTYGQHLALGFKAQFEQLGGKVAATETVNPDDKDFSAVLSRIRRLDPDMLYFGGDAPAGSRLKSQAAHHGITVPLMGGYGILDQAYINQVKDAAEGDLATSVGTPTELLPGARRFVEAYTAAGYADPYEAYGAYAYDAANVIIAAMAKVLAGKGKVTEELRAWLRQAVQDGTLDGATGNVAFDQYGDTTSRILTVYRVERDGSGSLAWKPHETKQFP